MLNKIAVLLDIDLIELIGDVSKFGQEDIKIQKRNKKLYLFNIVVMVLTILSSFVMLKGMKDTIPGNYDIVGNITRYAIKIEFLIIPGMSLLFIGFSIYFYDHLGKQKEYKKAVTIYQVIMLVLQIVILFFTLFLGIKYSVDIRANIIPTNVGVILGIFITASIFSLPIFNKEKNVLFGFRTKFTLSNDIAWNKVNKFQSVSALILTIISYVIVMISFSSWNVFLLGSIIISVVPTFIYHEVLRKKIT